MEDLKRGLKKRRLKPPRPKKPDRTVGQTDSETADLHRLFSAESGNLPTSSVLRSVMIKVFAMQVLPTHSFTSGPETLANRFSVSTREGSSEPLSGLTASFTLEVEMEQLELPKQVI